MPTRMYNDGGEYSLDGITIQPVHTRGECGHVTDMGVMLVLCKTAFRLTPEELDELIVEAKEGKQRLIDQAVEFKAEADAEQKDDEAEDD